MKKAFLVLFFVFNLNFTVLACEKWSFNKLSVSHVDDVAGLCSLWNNADSSVTKYLDVSYVRALMMLYPLSIQNYTSLVDGAEQYEKFWKLVNQKVYNRMSYSDRLVYFLNCKLTELRPELFISKEFFEEIKNEIVSDQKFDENLIPFIVKLNDKKSDNVIASAVCVKSENELTIESIIVQAKYRRKGVASFLLQQVEKYAKENAINSIIFELYSTNAAMLNCALKAGYTVINRRDDLEDMWGNSISLLYFSKNI